MIDASFDMRSKQAAIDGAYQYDTGQRLRLSGLPSPDEMNEADDFIAGDLAAMQVQFSHEGDSQAGSRLAQWDDMRGVWMCDIPDEYLTRAEPVNVYVYVSHGADENASRNKTMYSGVFTPVSRPAPNDTATEDQIKTWEQLVIEVDMALTTTDTARQNALNEVESTREAAQSTQDAANLAQDARTSADEATARLYGTEVMWGGMTVLAYSLPEGTEATAELDGDVLTLGIPRGATGAQGAAGEDGPTDISLSIENGVLTIAPK